MKITFKNNLKDLNGDILFVSVGSKNGSTDSPQADEIIKENGVKTLYLKCDEKMNLRKFFRQKTKLVMY